MSQETDLFTRLGGTRPMAALLGEKPSTVHSWKIAGRIPAAHQPKVIEKAGAAGIVVTAEEVVWPLGKPAEEDESAAPEAAAA